jgi:hypothetical protein
LAQVLNRKHWLTTIKFSTRWLRCSGDAEDGKEAWQEGRATPFTEDEALPLLFSYICIYFSVNYSIYLTSTRVGYNLDILSFNFYPTLVMTPTKVV